MGQSGPTTFSVLETDSNFWFASSRILNGMRADLGLGFENFQILNVLDLMWAYPDVSILLKNPKKGVYFRGSTVIHVVDISFMDSCQKGVKHS
jgi:hypothetical protein